MESLASRPRDTNRLLRRRSLANLQRTESGTCPDPLTQNQSLALTDSRWDMSVSRID